jgi:hypothetical protein
MDACWNAGDAKRYASELGIASVKSEASLRLTPGLNSRAELQG